MGDENYQKSQFNAGVGQAIEVRALQNVMNRAKLDLLSINMDPEFPQIPNHELILGLLNNLYQEVKPKCTEKEITELDKVSSLANNFKYIRPLNKVITKLDKQISMPNRENLRLYGFILNDYETKVRKALDKHELNSPSKGDVGKSVIQM